MIFWGRPRSPVLIMCVREGLINSGVLQRGCECKTYHIHLTEKLFPWTESEASPLYKHALVYASINILNTYHQTRQNTTYTHIIYVTSSTYFLYKNFKQRSNLCAILIFHHRRPRSLGNSWPCFIITWKMFLVSPLPKCS